MANRKKRTVYTESQWQKILKDYRSSGLSVEQYCQHRHLGYSTFKRWQQKLSVNSSEKDSFYELRRIAYSGGDGSEPTACPIRIAFKNGFTLYLQNDADMAKVAELIQHYHPH